MRNQSKKVTLSFRIDPEIHNRLKMISLQHDRITIQAMGEFFVKLYVDGYIKINEEENMVNHRRLYRAPNEKKSTFRINKDLHKELRSLLKKKHLTFQQIAENFFTDLVNSTVEIDISDSEIDNLDENCQSIMYIFENLNPREEKGNSHIVVEYD